MKNNFCLKTFILLFLFIQNSFIFSEEKKIKEKTLKVETEENLTTEKNEQLDSEYKKFKAKQYTEWIRIGKTKKNDQAFDLLEKLLDHFFPNNFSEQEFCYHYDEKTVWYLYNFLLDSYDLNSFFEEIRNHEKIKKAKTINEIKKFVIENFFEILKDDFGESIDQQVNFISKILNNYFYSYDDPILQEAIWKEYNILIANFSQEKKVKTIEEMREQIKELVYQKFKTERYAEWAEEEINNKDQQRDLLIGTIECNIKNYEHFPDFIWHLYNFLIDDFIGGEKAKTVKEIRQFLINNKLVLNAFKAKEFQDSFSNKYSKDIQQQRIESKLSEAIKYLEKNEENFWHYDNEIYVWHLYDFLIEDFIGGEKVKTIDEIKSFIENKQIEIDYKNFKEELSNSLGININNYDNFTIDYTCKKAEKKLLSKIINQLRSFEFNPAPDQKKLLYQYYYFFVDYFIGGEKIKNIKEIKTSTFKHYYKLLKKDEEEITGSFRNIREGLTLFVTPIYLMSKAFFFDDVELFSKNMHFLIKNMLNLYQEFENSKPEELAFLGDLIFWLYYFETGKKISSIKDIDPSWLNQTKLNLNEILAEPFQYIPFYFLSKKFNVKNFIATSYLTENDNFGATNFGEKTIPLKGTNLNLQSFTMHHEFGHVLNNMQNVLYEQSVLSFKKMLNTVKIFSDLSKKLEYKNSKLGNFIQETLNNGYRSWEPFSLNDYCSDIENSLYNTHTLLLNKLEEYKADLFALEELFKEGKISDILSWIDYCANIFTKDIVKIENLYELEKNDNHPNYFERILFTTGFLISKGIDVNTLFKNWESFGKCISAKEFYNLEKYCKPFGEIEGELFLANQNKKIFPKENLILDPNIFKEAYKKINLEINNETKKVQQKNLVFKLNSLLDKKLNNKENENLINEIWQNYDLLVNNFIGGEKVKTVHEIKELIIALVYEYKKMDRQASWAKNDNKNLQQKEVIEYLDFLLEKYVEDPVYEKIIWEEYNLLIDNFLGGEKAKSVQEIMEFFEKFLYEVYKEKQYIDWKNLGINDKINQQNVLINDLEECYRLFEITIEQEKNGKSFPGTYKTCTSLLLGDCYDGAKKLKREVFHRYYLLFDDFNIEEKKASSLEDIKLFLINNKFVLESFKIRMYNHFTINRHMYANKSEQYKFLEYSFTNPDDWSFNYYYDKTIAIWHLYHFLIDDFIGGTKVETIEEIQDFVKNLKEKSSKSLVVRE